MPRERSAPRNDHRAGGPSALRGGTIGPNRGPTGARASLVGPRVRPTPDARVSDPFGFASGALAYQANLAPGAHAEVNIAVPFYEAQVPAAAEGEAQAEPEMVRPADPVLHGRRRARDRPELPRPDAHLHGERVERVAVDRAGGDRGGNPTARRTMRTLGLTKIGKTVTHKDSPSLRGMLAKVAHLIEIEEDGSK